MANRWAFLVKTAHKIWEKKLHQQLIPQTTIESLNENSRQGVTSGDLFSLHKMIEYTSQKDDLLWGESNPDANELGVMHQKYLCWYGEDLHKGDCTPNLREHVLCAISKLLKYFRKTMHSSKSNFFHGSSK